MQCPHCGLSDAKHFHVIHCKGEKPLKQSPKPEVTDEDFIDPPNPHNLPPGSIYQTTVKGGKTVTRKRAWTWDDLKKDKVRFPETRFTPERTVPVTWNGLNVQFVAGETVTVPEVFVGIYMESLKDTHRALNSPFRVGIGAMTEADRNIGGPVVTP